MRGELTNLSLYSINYFVVGETNTGIKLIARTDEMFFIFPIENLMRLIDVPYYYWDESDAERVYEGNPIEDIDPEDLICSWNAPTESMVWPPGYEQITAHNSVNAIKLAIEEIYGEEEEEVGWWTRFTSWVGSWFS